MKRSGRGIRGFRRQAEEVAGKLKGMANNVAVVLPSDGEKTLPATVAYLRRLLTSHVARHPLEYLGSFLPNKRPRHPIEHRAGKRPHAGHQKGHLDTESARCVQDEAGT